MHYVVITVTPSGCLKLYLNPWQLYMYLHVIFVWRKLSIKWLTLGGHHKGLIVSKCSKVGVRMWFKWTKYSDQTNFEPKVLYEWNQGHWNVLGSSSLDPNIWVLLPFLDPNIGTLLWWKYIKDVVIMWLAWQTWLIQPGKFKLTAAIYILELWSKYQNCGITYQGQKVAQVDPHFGVHCLIQYFWCHFKVQTQIFSSSLNLNPLIQSGPGESMLDTILCTFY